MTVCSRCIMDTTVPEIVFDENGMCQFCKIHDELEILYPSGSKGEEKFNKLIYDIKKSGKGKKYDCIVGLSGGTDSTFLLYNTVKAGLKPLAVHFDNGWNSLIAVSNIEKTCKNLNVDLFTYVVNWEEFRDLQVSFLKAGTPDSEIPTDVGIHSILIKIAAKEKIKYVLNGHSFRNEGVSPLGWTYMDGRYIKTVQKKYGTKKLKTFPNFTLSDVLNYNILKGIKVIPFLNFMVYKKPEAKELLKKELAWQDYGGHHHESTYTKYFQSYILPVKFGIDKRKTELSAMIRSGQINRAEALKEIEKKYHFDKEAEAYILKKLQLNPDEWNNIMIAPIKSFKDYRTYYPLIRFLKFPIRIACSLKILPKLLYLKFLGVE